MRQKFSRFDLSVAAIAAILLAAIGLTILMGDRVGAQLEATGPTGITSSTARVTLSFNEVMNWDSVIEHLRFAPPLEGDFQSNNRTLRFIPAGPLLPGAEYSVTLQAGAESETGRKVLHDTSFNFRIRRPRVAYLSPSDSVPQNVWLTDPADPASAEQVTFSPLGVLNFDVSPDGARIAFAERAEGGITNIKLLDLASGTVDQATRCIDSDCNSPVWRPDGSMIAYHRIDLNSDLSQIGVSPTRVWVLDLTTRPYTERPLFDDNQILGYAPQWSADGSKVALFDGNNRAILVYTLADESLVMIPSQNGGSDIALSPDGTKLVFPRLVFDATTASARSTLQIADVLEREVNDLDDPEAPVDDGQTAWNPDGQHLAIARRYTDERATDTRQLYLLDTASGQLYPLVVDPRYFNGYFNWDVPGEKLVIQRFPQFTEDGELNAQGRPEVWTYDLASDTLTLVAQNAYLPRWVP